MNYYFAPMEGVAGYIYRNAHREYFKGVDKYFSPFVVTKPSGLMKKKEIRDIIPDNNKDVPLVPQIMSNKADEFIRAAAQIKEMGYEEVNLNLGCPSGTVVGKKRGSGFLRYPEELDIFLDEIYSKTDMKISIKTRIGFSEPEEFYKLINIFNKYPVYELIIHPRTRMEMYRGEVHMDMFSHAVNVSTNPLCYNGNIRDTNDYNNILESFPNLSCVMIGRGIIRNPNLIGQISGRDTCDKDKIRKFHDRLYHDYGSVLDGERNLLFKLKEVWLMMAEIFTNYDKYLKKIKKAQHLTEYNVVVASLFKEQDLNI